MKNLSSLKNARKSLKSKTKAYYYSVAFIALIYASSALQAMENEENKPFVQTIKVKDFPQSCTNFINDTLINQKTIKKAKDLRKAVQDLSFSEELNQSKIQEYIQGLSQDPSSTWLNNNSIFTLSGTIVGMSDLIDKTANLPNCSILCIYSYYFLFDQDIEKPGAIFFLEAPYWLVINEQRKINLKGPEGHEHKQKKAENGQHPGASGANGLSGHPGRNGGHFYGRGKKFNNLQSLMIDVSGGNGGKGQDGGDGRDGADGVDGKEEDLRNVNPGNDLIRKKDIQCVKREYLNTNHPEYDNETESLFKGIFTLGNTKFRETYQSGTEGKAGGDAGAGGKGGAGGKKGSVNIKREGSERLTIIDNDGKNGEDGNPGKPGKGGKHGQLFHRYYINEYACPLTRDIISVDSVATFEETIFSENLAAVNIVPGGLFIWGVSSGISALASSGWEKDSSPELVPLVSMNTHALSGQIRIANEEVVPSSSLNTLIPHLKLVCKVYGDTIEQGKKEICTSSKHLKKSFLEEIVKNLKEADTDQDINVTGYSFSKKKSKALEHYMDLCKAIYTDSTTRTFDVLVQNDSVARDWNTIISKKQRIDRFCQDLHNIREQQRALYNQPTLYEQQAAKTVPSQQVPFLSMDVQLSELQKKYILCIEQINQFLSEINRGILTRNQLSEIDRAQDELAKIQEEITNEYRWYFVDRPEGPLPQFKTADEKEYSLSNRAVVAASFLRKARLLENENITILDVGFRNLRIVKDFFYKQKKQMLHFKHNPESWFENWGEVDYIAYIEKDPTFNKKDKLFIVYSGSNSLKDWISNFTIGHTEFLDLSVHEGIGNLFHQSTADHQQNLMTKINTHYTFHRKPNEFKIITTGHSLGGALASLAAYYYKVKQYDKLCKIIGLQKDKLSVQTFTFGAPAIVSESAKDSMEKGLGQNNVFRTWVVEDPVVTWTNKTWAQRAAHIGRSIPLHNVEELPFNFLDELFWGHHGLRRYECYLMALNKDPLSSKHAALTSALKNIHICTKRQEALSQIIQELTEGK